MSVELKKVNERQYTVNDKVLQLDMNNNWVCNEELTVYESEVFRRHLATLESEN
jgi:hypothetical protein